MAKQESLILQEDQIRQKIKRIAYEIYESNFKETKMVLAGIEGQGYKLAKFLKTELEKISEIKVKLVEIKIDKANPHYDDIEISVPIKEIKGNNVVLIDDVLNTGRTLAYSMRPFLEIEIKKIEIAVLVDRSYTKFPVKANFTGLELTTTLKDHIDVMFEKNQFAVYLK